MCLFSFIKKWKNKDGKMQFCQCNLHKASNVAVGRLKNTIDLTKGNLDPKFFGKWAFPLILNKTLSIYVLRESLDYIKQELDVKGINYDYDDFHFHLAYIYLIFRDYSQAIKELELTTFSNIVQTTQSWKSFNSLISKAYCNYIQSPCYSSAFVFPNRPTEAQRIAFIESNYGTEYILIKIRWQMAVRFWDVIAISDVAYSECLSVVEFTAIFFERCLYDALIRLNSSSTSNTLGSIINDIKTAKTWSSNAEQIMQTISLAKDVVSLKLHFNNFKNQIASSLSFEDYAVSLMYLCRIIRNNCSHRMDLSYKLFTTSDELKQYISVLHEGILLTTALN